MDCVCVTASNPNFGVCLIFFANVSVHMQFLRDLVCILVRLSIEPTKFYSCLKVFGAVSFCIASVIEINGEGVLSLLVLQPSHSI